MDAKINWYEGFIPPFKSDDRVFVADRIQNASRVLDTIVSKVPVDVVWRDNGFLLLWLGWYDLQTMTFPGDNIPPTWCQAKYVFKTHKEAEAAAKWWPVEATKEEWLLAVGDRNKKRGEPGNIDDGCELLIGLVNDGTSRVRNWLSEAKEWGGLMEVDRQYVQALIDDCTNRPAALNKPDSKLAKILNQLGLNWRS